MLRFSNFLRNTTIHFPMCLYLVTCLMRVMVSLLCRSQGQAISSPFVAMGRDLDESTVAHSDTKINWPIKSDLENDIQVGITMNI